MTGRINQRVRKAALGMCVVTALAAFGVTGCGGSDTTTQKAGSGSGSTQKGSEATPSEKQLHRQFAHEYERITREEAQE